MRPKLGNAIIWLTPLPVLGLPWLAMTLYERHLHDAWTPVLRKVSIVAIAPGFLCGLLGRSSLAMVGAAGVCWYLLVVGFLGVAISPKGRRASPRTVLYFALAWILAIAALAVMWSRANLD